MIRFYNGLTLENGVVTHNEVWVDGAAISYVGIETGGKLYWGAGEHTDITVASIRALTAALNNYFKK